MRFKALGGAALALLALSAVPGSAADQIGSAVRIVNKVTGEIDQQQRRLMRPCSASPTLRVSQANSGHG
jgi:hypothetical protein